MCLSFPENMKLITVVSALADVFIINGENGHSFETAHRVGKV